MCSWLSNLFGNSIPGGKGTIIRWARNKYALVNVVFVRVRSNRRPREFAQTPRENPEGNLGNHNTSYQYYRNGAYYLYQPNEEVECVPQHANTMMSDSAGLV